MARCNHPEHLPDHPDRLPVMTDDLQLIKAMRCMRFVPDRALDTPKAQLALISYFHEAYGDTDQDTVAFAAEFVIVVRQILQGLRPVQLLYLTDFAGEEK